MSEISSLPSDDEYIAELEAKHGLAEFDGDRSAHDSKIVVPENHILDLVNSLPLKASSRELVRGLNQAELMDLARLYHAIKSPVTGGKSGGFAGVDPIHSRIGKIKSYNNPVLTNLANEILSNMSESNI